MPHITLEYMIMVPILLTQIILFPYLAVTMRNTWVDSSVNLELQEICSHMGSSMQQLYYTMNHNSISSGILNATLGTPTAIGDGYGNFYGFKITLQNATNANSNVKIMNLTLSISNTRQTYTLVTLGENANWQNNATFLSSSYTSITAIKTPGSITLSFWR